MEESNCISQAIVDGKLEQTQKLVRNAIENGTDTPNHANFPSAVLRPGENYTEHTVYASKRTKNDRYQTAPAA